MIVVEVTYEHPSGQRGNLRVEWHDRDEVEPDAKALNGIRLLCPGNSKVVHARQFTAPDTEVRP